MSLQVIMKNQLTNPYLTPIDWVNYFPINSINTDHSLLNTYSFKICVKCWWVHSCWTIVYMNLMLWRPYCVGLRLWCRVPLLLMIKTVNFAFWCHFFWNRNILQIHARAMRHTLFINLQHSVKGFRKWSREVTHGVARGVRNNRTWRTAGKIRLVQIMSLACHQGDVWVSQGTHNLMECVSSENTTWMTNTLTCY